jgi:hypothetical protein
MALEKASFDAVVITTPTPTHLPSRSWRPNTRSMCFSRSRWP